jgi:CRISPR-associated protein Cmr4
VDLPVQRERHTQWPVIPGSTLKGILRDSCRRLGGNNDELYVAFGPETPEADKHAGALSLTDARILAFPVRSLKGVFAWVTCLAVLERLKRDLSLRGKGTAATFDLPPAPAKDKALCQQNGPLLVDGNRLVLEEFEFERTGAADAVATWVSQRAVVDQATQQRLKSHLVVLHDDDFTHFVRHATEVVARVGLDYERKTVKLGALFYEEFLPAETLFYSVILVSPSRREGHRKSADEILEYLRGKLELTCILQIGGDETIGKGLCAVRLDNGKDGA